MTDAEKIEEVRSRLYDYVSSNPTGEHSAQARQILSTLPAHAPAEAAFNHGPRIQPDDELGIAAGPQTGRTVAYGRGGYPSATGAPAARVFGQEPRSQDQIDQGRDSHITAEMDDPGARMILQQAETMPLLHAVGLGLGGLGRKILGTRGAQAAKYLDEQGLPISEPAKPFGRPGETSAEFDPTKPVKGGSFDGAATGHAIEKLEAMKASPNLPRGAAEQLDAEIARIKGDSALAPNPDIARARDALRFQAPHGLSDMGALGAGGALLHYGHAGFGGSLMAAALALRNASPIAGRMLPLGEGAAGMGSALTAAAPQLSIVGSPLLQAVSGRE